MREQRMRRHLVARAAGLAGVAYGVSRRLRTAGAPRAVTAASRRPRPVDPTDPRAPARQRPPELGTRLTLGAVGVLGALYGVYALLSNPSRSHPVALFLWLAVAVALHDGVLVPVTLLLGALVARAVPLRARGYVQGALVASALVTAVAAPLVYRRGTATAAKALEQQDYADHLLWIVALIAVGAVVAWVVALVRDRRSRGSGAAAAPEGRA